MEEGGEQYPKHKSAFFALQKSVYGDEADSGGDALPDCRCCKGEDTHRPEEEDGKPEIRRVLPDKPKVNGIGDNGIEHQITLGGEVQALQNRVNDLERRAGTPCPVNSLKQRATGASEIYELLSVGLGIVTPVAKTDKHGHGGNEDHKEENFLLLIDPLSPASVGVTGSFVRYPRKKEGKEENWP